jgi:hypothetical protein
VYKFESLVYINDFVVHTHGHFDSIYVTLQLGKNSTHLGFGQQPTNRPTYLLYDQFPITKNREILQVAVYLQFCWLK